MAVNDDQAQELIRKAMELVVAGVTTDSYLKVGGLPAASAGDIPPIPISGAVSPSGLSIGGLITEVTLSSATWTKLPATNLTDRNGMGFQNNSVDIIVVNFLDLGASVVGWQVKPNGEFFIDVSDSIDIFAKALSNAPTVLVMEVA